jgi:hypothetical protein
VGKAGFLFGRKEGKPCPERHCGAQESPGHTWSGAVKSNQIIIKKKISDANEGAPLVQNLLDRMSRHRNGATHEFRPAMCR